MLAAAAELAGRWPALAPGELRAIVRALIARVVLHPDRVEIEILPQALGDLLQPGPESSHPAAPGAERVVLTVPARLARSAGETRLIVPGRTTRTAPARPNPALIKALVRAHAALEQLRAGRHQAVAHDLARTLPLACLAPDITQAILDGTQPPNLTLGSLRRPLPLAWTEQRRALGFPAAGTATNAEPGPCP